MHCYVKTSIRTKNEKTIVDLAPFRIHVFNYVKRLGQVHSYIKMNLISINLNY